MQKNEYGRQTVVGIIYTKRKNYRQKWEAASQEFLMREKKLQWSLRKLKKHLPTEVAVEHDKDQKAREKNLEDLLRKVDHCPNVSVLIL